MLRPRTLLAFTALVALTALVAAPASEACCRPCQGFCDKTNLDEFCCTGIPVPGNACGLTTCEKYLSSRDRDTRSLAGLLAEAPFTPATAEDSQDCGVILIARVDAPAMATSRPAPTLSAPLAE